MTIIATPHPLRTEQRYSVLVEARSLKRILLFLAVFLFGQSAVDMSRGSGIIPDESMFNEFKRQCLSTENWMCKYDKYDMEVWVEAAPLSTSANNKGNFSKVHKIKVKCLPASNYL